MSHFSKLIAATGCLPVAAFSFFAAAQAVPVELTERDDGYALVRDGSPVFITGAGGQSKLAELKAAGGNSFRTWGHERAAENFAGAEDNGLLVTMGLWLGHERHGFNYDDPAQVEAQRQMVRDAVTKYRDQPTLLMWGVGNEVALASDPEKVFPEINRIAGMVKELDPSHPVMTVIAGASEAKVKAFMRLCPNVDVLGVNAYGEAAEVPELLDHAGYDGPYVLTEFGPRGHWESEKTVWGVPIEPSSAQKAQMYRESYTKAVAEQPGRCLGSYVFLWGHKQETTATWFGMFLEDGDKTPTVDVMTELWSGKPPADHAPVVSGIESAVSRAAIDPGTPFTATVLVRDEEQNLNELSAEWLIVPETTDRRMGGDAEQAPEAMATLTRKNRISGAELVAPLRPGPYRLYVTVRDGQGGAGTANVPFFVMKTVR